MKYYQLTKDLPTFKKGQIFYINQFGSLVSNEGNIVAYVGSTIAKFPNILGDWFVEVPEPERDKNTKYAFVEYLSSHKDERFFQAVRNFARKYLDGTANFIVASDSFAEGSFIDTFHWECDDMLKEEE